jgi:protein-tyrosine phosphatase
MIDLHSHILPGIDDGAKTLDIALEMARMAVDDGIHTMACTPHIYPGLYMNNAAGIEVARDALQAELEQRGIALHLVTGADVHLVPGLLEDVRARRVPTLAGSRYLLLEPSHHVAPPRFQESVFSLVAAGYTPVITHPERLLWIEDHYPVFGQLVRQGAWMQVTAGALTGMFGPRARYWGERMLDEGLVHLLATDAHSSGRRVPRLAEARAVAQRLLGAEEADRLVLERPQAILDDRPVSEVTPPPAQPEAPPASGPNWLQRLLRWR